MGKPTPISQYYLIGFFLTTVSTCTAETLPSLVQPLSHYQIYAAVGNKPGWMFREKENLLLLIDVLSVHKNWLCKLHNLASTLSGYNYYKQLRLPQVCQWLYGLHAWGGVIYVPHGCPTSVRILNQTACCITGQPVE